MRGQRRKLIAIDDPLATPAPMQPTTPPPAPSETAALYVRLRLAESEHLARAAFELRVHKRELVGALIARHVDPTDAGLATLRETIEEFRRLCA